MTRPAVSATSSQKATRPGWRIRLLQGLCHGALVLIASLLSLMSRQRLAAIGNSPLTSSLIDRLMVRIQGRQRQYTDTNLALIFPHLSEARRQQIKRDYYGNVIATLPTLWRLRNGPELHQSIEVSGLEHLQAATSQQLGQNNGILFVTCHSFDWEVSNLNLTHLGYPACNLYRDYSNSLINHRALNSKNRYGDLSWYYPTTRTGELVERVVRGDHAFLFLDVRTKRGRNGHQINVCGQPAWVSTFAAQIALAHHKQIIPVVIQRDPQGRYHQHFEAPIALDSGDPVMITAAICDALSAHILKHPANWALWDSNFWAP